MRIGEANFLSMPLTSGSSICRCSRRRFGTIYLTQGFAHMKRPCWATTLVGGKAAPFQQHKGFCLRAPAKLGELVVWNMM